MAFQLKSKFKPAGDQPGAIDALISKAQNGAKDLVLHGVTGSGKTFTIANVIQTINKPTLVISHNKTLAWQLYQEFREFFPQNNVHYFVSYYDYYQPEAYMPTTDTYIAKDASINEKIDKMRHGAVQSLLTNPDTIVVASVSCIYNLGSPQTYQKVSWEIKEGQQITRREFLYNLVRLGYERNDTDPHAGKFRARENRVEIYPPTGKEKITVEIDKNVISKIKTPESTKEVGVRIYPANFWITPKDKLRVAINNIHAELQERLAELKKQGKEIEAYRLEKKTNYDLEMMEQVGYTSGIENYSSHLDFRNPNDPPFTLLNYFSPQTPDTKGNPNDFLTIIDESHMTIPQIRGMHAGDKARKQTLIEHGFRLPSALDNRPLNFKEFNERIGQTIYMSATPSEYELEKAHTHNDQDTRNKIQTNPKSQKLNSKQKLPTTHYQLPPSNVVEQIVRPTGLLDPPIEVRGTKQQMQNAIGEIKKERDKGNRTLVVTITKRLAEEIAQYLKDEGLKVDYIHSEITTLNRPILMNKLRTGEYDVLVGINLLREGLDFPEVSLVIIFDADKEGFLRNETTLLQTAGRAARHIEGRVIMYADKITRSMKLAINETRRRRKIQEKYNKEHQITPSGIQKDIYELPEELINKEDEKEKLAPYKNMAISEIEREMKRAAKNMDFELAAKLKDEIKRIEDSL